MTEVRVTETELREYLQRAPFDDILAAARRVRDARCGGVLSYSRKVFIPLTQLCRDVCHYCTFAKTPRRAGPAYLNPDEVLEIA